MGVIDAPSWLLSAFVRTALAVGATAPRHEIERYAERLAQRWQEPGRSFHNVRHLIDVLARVDELSQETHDPDVVRLAAWYHGAIFSAAAQTAYAGRGGEDEVASADVARAELSDLGVPEKVVERVCDLIRNLRRHDADPRDIDALALCDADLAVLAAEPQRYTAYRMAVREEYAHLPLRDYLEARIAILSKLVRRRRLFVSPFSASWEEPARENLSAELQRLQAELAALGEGDRPVDAPERAHEERREPSSEGRFPPSGDGRVVRPSGDGRARGAEEAGRGPWRQEPQTAPAPPAHASADRPAASAPSAASAASAPASPSAGDAAQDSAQDELDEAPAARDSAQDEPSEAPAAQDVDEQSPFTGIERDPEFLRSLRPREKERRGRRRDRRAERADPSPTPAGDDDASTGSLFRPPPRLPRT